MIEHTIHHHSTENGFFKCIAKENCEEFNDARELAYHLILKHYDLLFTKIDLSCPECKEIYNSFPEYNEHYCCIKGVINRSKRFCNSCNIEFSSHKRFRLHQMFHLPNYRPKICFLCDKVFHIEEDFYEHIMYGHKTEEELELVCKQCDINCASKKLYKKHEKMHLKNFVAKCHICSNSYSSYSQLKIHINHVHRDREHSDCKICGKEFNFKGQLKLHIEKHNELRDGKIFTCSVCGLCEPHKEDFQNHDHFENPIEFYEKTTNLVYACEFCEAAFIGIVELRDHKDEVSHTTYDCDMCDEKFNRFSNLKSHRLTHAYGLHKIAKYPTGRKYVCNTKVSSFYKIDFSIVGKYLYFLSPVD